MPFTFAELKGILKSGIGVDAEGSGRYSDANDFIPASQSALWRATTATNYQLANVKGSEEAASEISYLRIFQTNTSGGIHFSTAQLGHEVWSVTAVIAEPGIIPGQNPVIVTNPLGLAGSTWRGDLAYAPTSGKPVKRITIEQVAMTRDNMFMAGNERLAANPKMRTYGYCVFGNRGTGVGTPITPTVPFAPGVENIVILPASLSVSKLFAVAYLKAPAVIVDDSSFIDFPISMIRTIADWALQYLTNKQGGLGIPLAQAVEKDAAQLFQMSTT